MTVDDSDLPARYARCKELEAAAQARIAKLEVALLHVMRARYTDGGEAYAYHNGCILIDHPMRYLKKPPFKENRCVCGEVVEEEV